LWLWSKVGGLERIVRHETIIDTARRFNLPEIYGTTLVVFPKMTTA
jgi:hypothetical protein